MQRVRRARHLGTIRELPTCLCGWIRQPSVEMLSRLEHRNSRSSRTRLGLVRKRSLAAGAMETMKRVRLLQAFYEIEVGQNTVIAIQAGLAVRRDKDGTNPAYAC